MSDKGIASTYVLIDGVWVPSERQHEFGYSDGDEAEERIAAAIAGCDDVSLFSRALREYQTDWPSRYHLSASRANLLRPLADQLHGRVLEVGSGCGALSRYLGELGGEVTALEGSGRRARITASRCRDLPNVRVVNDVLERFVGEGRYDAVTLIGVLEYARVYAEDKSDPTGAWLRKAYSLLNDDGCLVLAIENQLGLKYLAGMPEDHVGQAMFGISDNYSADSVATFGRKQLQQMLELAGFEYCEVLLPFPDYKFPSAVAMPAAYDGSFPAFDASMLASQSASSDPQLPYPPLFSLERAWGLMGANGLLQDVTNSFLIVARKRPAARQAGAPIAHHFATERVPVFCKHVTFRPGADGATIHVERERLAEDDHAERVRPISLRLEPEKYYVGALHNQALEVIVTRRGWRASDVADWLNKWLLVLLDEVRRTEGGEPDPALMPGWTLDALPRNLVLETGTAQFIDLEWEWHGELELGYLVYRALIGSFTSLTAVAMPEDIRHLNLSALLQDVMPLVGCSADDEAIERFLDLDSVVTRLVFGRDSGLSLKGFNSIRLRALPDVVRMSTDWHSLVSETAQRVADIARSYEIETQEVRNRDEQLRQLVVSSAERERMRDMERDEQIRRVEQEYQVREAARIEVDKLKDQELDLLRGVLARNDEMLRRMEELAEQARRNEQQMGRDLLQAKDAIGVYEASLQLASARAAELDRLLASTSWRVTMPLRVLRNLLRPQNFRQMAGRGARRLYLGLPFSDNTRRSLKNASFRALPFLFSRTNAYRRWQASRVTAGAAGWTADPVNILVATEGVSPDVSLLRRYVQSVLSLPAGKAGSEYVPISERAKPREVAARVIAFYLPQFHPIPENDEWWGRGFTEWTNVAKAVPQFIGHYQPHLPGELGFYDLRLVDVMRRQAELAKLYGVEGFCFHYYWFAGKRLLERPLDQLLASDINLPFCICWANENWTRRWDGLESEVLLAQDYGPEDDRAFITALEPVLRDRRYIRVGGRPLIILYRPSLLPDAAATLERWRQHCRDAGIGELFLCMVQFDKLDPREYGFDAAVEFPPHKIAAGLPSINGQLEIVNPSFQGNVVDYADVVRSSLSQPVPEFDMVRGVFPGWDNDARKPGRGYSVARSSPARYRAWLRSAIAYARRHPVRGESLVFVNAWNEWAEGAHLEPDRRYGYAYLEATRQALRKPLSPRRPERIVVVIHAFYPELLSEMFEAFSAWTVAYRLILTTVEEKAEMVREQLRDAGLQGEVRVYDNRGRDILPFLHVMDDLRDEALVLKLHTKRSLHRQDGESWRRDMINKLIGPAAVERIISAFRESDELGLVAPDGHILPMTTYWGANAEAVYRLAQQMDTDPVDPAISTFAAGSMFYVRPQAIESIMALGLGPDDFETESGQVDGTMAHAIERCFSIATCSAGYYIASSGSPMDEDSGLLEAYAYAEPSLDESKNAQ